MLRSLVGSEMCIRDSLSIQFFGLSVSGTLLLQCLCLTPSFSHPCLGYNLHLVITNTCKTFIILSIQLSSHHLPTVQLSLDSTKSSPQWGQQSGVMTTFPLFSTRFSTQLMFRGLSQHSFVQNFNMFVLHCSWRDLNSGETLPST